MSANGQIEVNEKLCKSCGLCIKYCPKSAIAKSGKWNKIGYDYIAVDEEKCVYCQTCYLVCPEIVFTFA